MAQPSNSIPVPQPGPGPSVSVNKPVPGADIPIRPDYQIQTIVNSALPNPKILDKVGSSRQHVLKSGKPGDPLPYAFGRTFVRPVVIGADDTSDYLVLDLMWSVGEIEHLNGISQIGWNYALYFPDLGYKNVSDTSLYEHFTGTQGQAASTIMTALKGSYPAYPGIAHSVISMQLGWNLNIVGAGDWIKVIDPRTSPYTTVWTRNPALILADMLTRCGYTMDYSSVADAADYCDELVGVTSPQIERWKISGVIYDRADLQSWIHTMAQYAHCFVDKSGSTFYLRPDKPRASSHTVTADDMVEGSVRLKLRGRGNTVDGVRVTYGFSLRTLDAEYGTLTDPGTVTHLQMPFWAGSFPYQGAHAKRHAEEVYRKSQLEIEELEFVSFDEGLNRTVGDVGTITNAAVGLSAKTMTLLDNQQAEPGRWRRRYTEYSAGVYQDTSYSLTYNDTDLDNPYGPPDGPTPTLTDEWDSSSPRNRRFKVTFTGISWAYLKDYYVKIVDTTTLETVFFETFVPLSSASPNVYTVYPTGFELVEGFDYTVEVYVRSITDTLSATPGYGDDIPFWVTAKEFGGLSNYYQLGDTASPRTWAGGLIASTGASDVYQDMTLVFCIYPLEYDAEDMIFGSTGGEFAIACNTDDGGLWLSAEDWVGVQKNAYLTASGSPTNAGYLTKNTWHAVMISYDGNQSSSPEGNTLKIWVDGVQRYNGTWGTGRAAHNPMDYFGPCFVGRGEMPSGSPNLRPGLNCYLSFVWCDEVYFNPSVFWGAFFDADNKPCWQGVNGEDRTGLPPDTYCPDGDFTNNLGSGPNWTEVGTVADAPSSPTD